MRFVMRTAILLVLMLCVISSPLVDAQDYSTVTYGTLNYQDEMRERGLQDGSNLYIDVPGMESYTLYFYKTPRKSFGCIVLVSNRYDDLDSLSVAIMASFYQREYCVSNFGQTDNISIFYDGHSLVLDLWNDEPFYPDLHFGCRISVDEFQSSEFACDHDRVMPWDWAIDQIPTGP